MHWRHGSRPPTQTGQARNRHRFSRRRAGWEPERISKPAVSRRPLYPQGKGVEKTHFRAFLSIDAGADSPRKYRECSGGQKRLAQIARALLPAPGLLILDEPTTGLDPVTRQKVWAVLHGLRSQLQMTIFFTTHYMEEAAFSDAICVLDHGHILLCDTLDRIETAQQTSGRELDLNALYLRLLGESR